MGTADILRAWNCPPAYARDDYDPPARWHDWPQDVRDAYRRAGNAMNGFWEHDAALVAMIEARDADAIREWADLDTFLEVATGTGDPDDDEGNQAYASECVCALEELAEAVDEME